METKQFGGRVTEIKVEQRNEVPVGIVAGHIAAWAPDEGGRFGVPDRFRPGAFLNSIEEHKRRNMRQVRLKDHHHRTIGGFPIQTVREDSIGLFGRGEINLETQLGKEAFSLAKQGVLVDFSIGFSAVEDSLTEGFRDISEAIIWEGSIVDEPNNQSANITEVKISVPFQDLPLAQRLAPWNPVAAKDRVKQHTESKQAPSESFKNAFVWMDEERLERFDGYKIQIADVDDGQLIAVPRAIFNAAAALKTKSIGIPEEDRAGVIQHLEKYYAKMGLVSPFDDDEKRFFGIEEVKTFTCRDMQRALIDSGAFSRSAAIQLAGRFNGLKDPDSATSILRELQAIKDAL
jgi:HK97 family phage prohead protease